MLPVGAESDDRCVSLFSKLGLLPVHRAVIRQMLQPKNVL